LAVLLSSRCRTITLVTLLNTVVSPVYSSVIRSGATQTFRLAGIVTGTASVKTSNNIGGVAAGLGWCSHRLGGVLGKGQHSETESREHDARELHFEEGWRIRFSREGGDWIKIKGSGRRINHKRA